MVASAGGNPSATSSAKSALGSEGELPDGDDVAETICCSLHKLPSNTGVPMVVATSGFPAMKSATLGTVTRAAGFFGSPKISLPFATAMPLSGYM